MVRWNKSHQFWLGSILAYNALKNQFFFAFVKAWEACISFIICFGIWLMIFIASFITDLDEEIDLCISIFCVNLLIFNVLGISGEWRPGRALSSVIDHHNKWPRRALSIVKEDNNNDEKMQRCIMLTLMKSYDFVLLFVIMSMRNQYFFSSGFMF